MSQEEIFSLELNEIKKLIDKNETSVCTPPLMLAGLQELKQYPGAL